MRVIQCRIFITSSGTTGIAVLTSSYRVFMITSITEPRIRRMAEIPGQLLNGSTLICQGQENEVANTEPWLRV